MRKIFIDVGAYTGDTIEKFFKGEVIGEGDLIDYEVYAFEPHPVFFWQMTQKTYPKAINFIEAAAWVNDKGAEFTLDVDQSGTLCQDNELFPGYKENGRTIRVKTIDFSKWLADNFIQDDYIVVKLDCEGAEFALLDKMIAEGTEKMVDRFLIEFHERMFNGKEDQHLLELREYFGDRITAWY